MYCWSYSLQIYDYTKICWKTRKIWQIKSVKQKWALMKSRLLLTWIHCMKTLEGNNIDAKDKEKVRTLQKIIACIRAKIFCCIFSHMSKAYKGYAMGIPTAVELYNQRSIPVNILFLPPRFWSYLSYLDSEIFFPGNLCDASNLSGKGSAVSAGFVCSHTEEILPRHALLFIKDVFPTAKVWQLQPLPHCFILHPRLT